MTLSQEVVLDAAAAVASSSGLDALSVRSVASALDVTPMALYRHVGDAAALEAATVERLLASLSVVEDGDCRAWAHGARRVLAATPGLARHVLLRWTGIPRCLVVVDRLVAAMPPGADPVAAANVVFTYVLVRAQAEEELRRAGGVSRDLAVLRSMRAEVPLLWANRRRYQRARLDEHFAYGLEAILRGIGAHP
jgi:AcrR family transcriptional regulator